MSFKWAISNDIYSNGIAMVTMVISIAMVITLSIDSLTLYIPEKRTLERKKGKEEHQIVHVTRIQ